MELPPLDADAAELRECYAPAMHWADVFWNACLHRCVAAGMLHALPLQRPGPSAELLSSPPGCFPAMGQYVRAPNTDSTAYLPMRCVSMASWSGGGPCGLRGAWGPGLKPGWPAASAARADGADVDGRLLLEALLADALLVHAAPRWPAALSALLRLVGALIGGRGLASPDAAVRQVGILSARGQSGNRLGFCTGAQRLSSSHLETAHICIGTHLEII